MADLSVEFAGIKFKNPVFASSGPITDGVYTIEQCCKNGAGAVICKTVTPIQPLRVYPRPHDFSLEKDGLRETSLGGGKLVADEDPEYWTKNILPEVLEICDKYNTFYIQSILGDGHDIDSWVWMAEMMEEKGVKAFELNFSCPHSSAVALNTGAQLGMNPEAAARVVKAVKKAVSVPVFAKMTSRNQDVDLVAAACCEAGADGISMINNQVGQWVDVENQSYYGIPVGTWGWGGRFMQPIALEKTAKVQNNPKVTKPVYGAAGVWNYEDALRFIMLGNYAVQLQIACMERGYGIFQEIVDGIEAYMERKGISSLEEIRGIVLPKFIPNRQVPPDPKGSKFISVDESKCVGCGRCSCCMWGVLEVINGKASPVHIDRCHGCGWCASFCRKNALKVVDKDGNTVMEYK